MEKEQKIQTEKMSGDPGYVNKNCWLAKNLNYPPSKRCQYCELKFSNCLFERYLLISLILVSFLSLAAYLTEKNISKSLIVSVFVLIITYGYFFNKSTEKIIVSNFEEKKSKNAFKELSMTLQQKVAKATAELQAGKSKVEKAYEVEKEAREELQKLNQAKTEFLNLASHQLRTPTSVIKGIASMIKEGSFDKFSKEKQATFIEGLYDKSLKLEDIINDILNASEMTSTKFKVTPEHAQWIDPEAFTKELASGFEPKLAERQVDLKVNIEKSPLPKILCQQEFLKDAIGNLIENAIKYTPSANADSYARNIREGKAEINVSVFQKDKDVVFQVQDNGIGIPKEEINSVFKKFQRGSNARDMYTDGSGLGLFIAKEIIEGHGGRVWAESELGRGSSFFASLPTNPPKDINIKATIIERAEKTP
ncbi:HAMP domain-containing histidine kinase [Patescibacteria group bacterium]|nr:HAMP domain-containing histidine kinase [Patescibacteria group bacterium]MBU2264917.1 HAMP domain-containing histidine kinase [Patescibacteria group bacterium]